MKARLVVSYNGAGFHGFAPNHDVRTVLGDRTESISRVVRTPVDLTGAGRTDAGVHAWGQVVSGDLPDATDLDALVRRVNKMCGPAIAVRSAEWTSDDFNARFSAVWRQYRYDVWNSPTPNPLLAARSWWVRDPLDLDAMDTACGSIVGEHDFTTFCRRAKVAEGEAVKSLVRRVHSARWSDVSETFGDAAGRSPSPSDSRLVRFEIRANAFCHQMVRSLVGTTVDVGTGRFAPADVAGMLAARDRATAGRVAPPDGLTLWRVGYPN
ncbi:tRNA pseudouridine(38-40) synthase TruA [soil metagenome]